MNKIVLYLCVVFMCVTLTRATPIHADLRLAAGRSVSEQELTSKQEVKTELSKEPVYRFKDAEQDVAYKKTNPVSPKQQQALMRTNTRAPSQEQDLAEMDQVAAQAKKNQLLGELLKSVEKAERLGL